MSRREQRRTIDALRFPLVLGRAGENDLGDAHGRIVSRRADARRSSSPRVSD
jgi:hypothetical protein